MRKTRFKVVITNRRISYYAQGKYCKIYNKGEIVTAEKHTIGIAVFKRKQNAEKFLDRHVVGQIITVEPIGRGKTFDFVFGSQDEDSLDFFYRELLECPKFLDFAISRTTTPKGTVFYPAVKVLD